MVEPRVEVGLDLGHGLVRVRRDDPPLGDLLDRQLVGQPLHLRRAESTLCFCSARQRQRRPEPAVLQRPLVVAVVGHLDLDRPVDRGRVAPRRLRALLDRRQQLVGVELHALARGADEPVTRPARVLRHHRAARGDVDRHRLLGLVVHGGVDGLVELAVERHAVLGPQLPHQPHRLAQPGEPALEVRPLRAGHGRLVERLARAQPEHDPVRVQARHRRERLRDHRRVVAERRGQHARAEHDPRRPLPHRRHERQRERRVPARRAARAGSGRTPRRCRARPPRPAPRTPPAPAARTAPPTPCSRSAAAPCPSSPRPPFRRPLRLPPCYTGPARTANGDPRESARWRPNVGSGPARERSRDRALACDYVPTRATGQARIARMRLLRVVQRTPHDLGIAPTRRRPAPRPRVPTPRSPRAAARRRSSGRRCSRSRRT